MSINENTVSTIQVGKKLKVGFIANQVTDFTFSIVPVAAGEALMTENIIVDPNTFIVSKEFDIPNQASWIGDALLKISYTSAGQVIEKQNPLLLQKVIHKCFLLEAQLPLVGNQL